MSYIKGKDRYQKTFLPPVIDDYIAQNSEVRIIDAFVNSLKNIKFEYSDYSKRGNQPYDPLDMLKLYIYCYLKCIRSSRKMEKECRINLDLIWLINGLTPDDRTICDFRKNNKEQLYKVLKEFTVICKKAELFSNELIAVDGSKFKASNSRDRMFSKTYLKNRLEKIDAHIEKYLNETDNNDKQEMKIEKISGEKVQEIINNLNTKKEYCRELLNEMEEKDETQISLTDKDCRLMKKRNGEVNPCFNVQLSADSKHNMIIDFEVTNHMNDTGDLYNMSSKAKEILEADKLTVLADAGYENREEFEKCIKNNINPITDIPKNKEERKDGTYSKDVFIYDKKGDVYICPGKRKLCYLGQSIKTKRKKKLKFRIYADKDKCSGCKYKNKCFKNQTGYRRIERWYKEDIVDNMKTEEAKEMLKQRKGIIEPIFGILKHDFGFTGFLTRGFESVKAEFSIAALTYNFRRAVNILGFDKLMQLLTA